MAEKNKSINLVVIVICIVVVIALGFGIYKLVQKNNINVAKSSEDITISDKDSKEVKIEKIQKKIELLSNEIEEIENKRTPELTKLNELYEEYVSVMNELQVASPADGEIPVEETEEVEAEVPEE